MTNVVVFDSSGFTGGAPCRPWASHKEGENSENIDAVLLVGGVA